MYCNGDPVNNTDSNGHLTDVERYVLMATTLVAMAIIIVATGGTGAVAVGAALGLAGGAVIGFGSAGLASILNGSDLNKAASDAADGLVIGSSVGIIGGALAGVSVPATSVGASNAISNAYISNGLSYDKGQMLKYDLQFFAKKRDIQQIVDISRKYNIDRHEFGDYLENYKAIHGMPPNHHLEYSELEKIVREFRK